MVAITWHFNGYVLVYLCLCFLFIKIVNTEEAKRSWFESRPHVSMDFNVHLDAGKEDCFFHYVQPDAAFYVSYQVN